MRLHNRIGCARSLNAITLPLVQGQVTVSSSRITTTYLRMVIYELCLLNFRIKCYKSKVVHKLNIINKFDDFFMIH